MMHRLAIALLVPVMLSTSGCFWRKAKPTIPPRIAPLPPRAKLPPKPEPIPLPPQILADAVEIASLPYLPAEYEIARPAPPPKPPKPPPKPTVAVVQPAEPPPVAEVPPLVPMLPHAKQVELKRELDDLLRRAEDSLARIGDRRLDESQQTDVLRARTFIRQAQELRHTDLVTAHSLARRADAFAQNVLSSLR